MNSSEPFGSVSSITSSPAMNRCPIRMKSFGSLGRADTPVDLLGTEAEGWAAQGKVRRSASERERPTPHPPALILRLPFCPSRKETTHTGGRSCHRRLTITTNLPCVRLCSSLFALHSSQIITQLTSIPLLHLRPVRQTQGRVPRRARSPVSQPLCLH